MRILELQELAKERGYDSLRFRFKTFFGTEKTGKWEDAYLGLFKVDGSSGICSVSGWREFFRDELFEFEVID